MTDLANSEDILFQTTDIFGNSVRTTKGYWQKIKTEKHQELVSDTDQVIKTIKTPDEVYTSVQDAFIRLFYKKVGARTLVVLVKYIDQIGFVVTCYETTKVKRKGVQLWPK